TVVPCPTCAPHPIRLTGTGAVRVVQIEPAQIDFGDVVAGATATADVQIVNRSREPITLSSMAGEAAGLSLSVKTPLVLAPEQRLPATLRFTPDSFGQRGGKLVFAVSDGAPPELAWKAFSYGALLTATPAGVPSMAALIHTTRSMRITLSNGGLDPKGLRPLQVTAITLEGPGAAAFRVSAPSLPWTLGEPGATGVFDFSFSP